MDMKFNGEYIMTVGESSGVTDCLTGAVAQQASDAPF